MAIVIVQANSTTLILNGQVINDFVEGDNIEIIPTNPESSRTYGVGKSINIRHRSDKDVTTIKFKVMKFSESDVWLNSQLNSVTPIVFDGSIKTSFTSDGSTRTETFRIESGSFSDKPTVKNNSQEGEAAVEYTLECYCTRQI